MGRAEQFADDLGRARMALEAVAPSLARFVREAPRVIVVACGSTALGLEAGLQAAAGLGGAWDPLPVRVVEDPESFRRLVSTWRDAVVLGLSVSGGSAEVLASLEIAQDLGRPSAFVSRDAGACPGALPLTLGPVPTSPRASPGIGAYLGVVLSRARNGYNGDSLPAIQPESPPAWSQLWPFLEDAFAQKRFPVFISAQDDFWARLLEANTMEFLKIPAFRVRYPDWSHHLLWSLDPRTGPAFAFAQVGPLEDLPDGRLAKIRRRFAGLNVSSLDIPNPDGSALSTYAGLLIDFHALALTCGVDPDEERH